MIPFADDAPRRGTPWVTWALILMNVYVFYHETLLSGPELYAFFRQWAVVPRDFFTGPTPYITLVSAMFLHGSWLHLLGNMLFLWVFGDNVEGRLGSLRYLAFYLVTGVLGNALHILTHPTSTVPALGASGAVAGVLGGYWVAFPGAQVRTLLFLGIFITVVRLPAFLMLLYWFLLQVIGGLSVFQQPGSETVAYFAHIGGFLAGIFLMRLWGRRRPSWPGGF
ncbi:MAG: rhomboid family intramembrane serine protease [Clostridiales bacterium]|nr:rhomboid family intramembrane serine protease [Clostridiales bacterium]